MSIGDDTLVTLLSEALHYGRELAKVLLIYLACFAPLAMSARAGVRSVAQEQVHAAYSMGASKWQVIRHVIVPAAMPGTPPATMVCSTCFAGRLPLAWSGSGASGSGSTTTGMFAGSG